MNEPATKTPVRFYLEDIYLEFFMVCIYGALNIAL